MQSPQSIATVPADIISPLLVSGSHEPLIAATASNKLDIILATHRDYELYVKRHAELIHATLAGELVANDGESQCLHYLGPDRLVVQQRECVPAKTLLQLAAKKAIGRDKMILNVMLRELEEMKGPVLVFDVVRAKSYFVERGDVRRTMAVCGEPCCSNTGHHCFADGWAQLRCKVKDNLKRNILARVLPYNPRTRGS